MDVRKLFQNLPFSTDRSTKSREAFEETCNRFDVASPYCVRKVVQHNRQKSTHLTQVFDSPRAPGRARSMV